MSPVEVARMNWDGLAGSPEGNRVVTRPEYVPALGVIPATFPLAPESASDHALWEARQDYKSAGRTSSLSAETELRMGDLDLSRDKPKNALDHFAKALHRSKDADVTYLAYLLSATANTALKRTADADAARRKVAALKPSDHDPLDRFVRGDLLSFPSLADSLRLSLANWK